MALNSAVYEAAKELIPNNQAAFHRGIQRIERRIQQSAKEINIPKCNGLFVNQQTVNGKIKKIVSKLRQEYLTLTLTTLNTMKQRCLGRIRSLGVMKNGLKGKTRGIRDTNQFMIEFP